MKNVLIVAEPEFSQAAAGTLKSAAGFVGFCRVLTASDIMEAVSWVFVLNPQPVLVLVDDSAPKAVELIRWMRDFGWAGYILGCSSDKGVQRAMAAAARFNFEVSPRPFWLGAVCETLGLMVE